MREKATLIDSATLSLSRGSKPACGRYLGRGERAPPKAAVAAADSARAGGSEGMARSHRTATRVQSPGGPS